MPTVVLAMSGGVDSSVAAQLLLDDGYDVVGVFMRHGSESPAAGCDIRQRESFLPVVTQPQPLAHKQGCCSARDAEDARRVARRLRIPFYALNLQQEFDRIVDYFVAEYTLGRTPNPCVMCNHWIKFGKLFAYADSMGAEFVATGHYARMVKNQVGSWQLARGVDRNKDQSYVLFGVEPSLFARMLLPVGAYEKPEIRRRAADLGLGVAAKRDSQEICFVTAGQHAQFVSSRRGSAETGGEIVSTTGEVVGHHMGIERYTVGQRKGLGVALGVPYFVTRIEPDTRRVVIGRHEDLARLRLTAGDANWLVAVPVAPTRCAAQIRYNGRAVAATVHPLSETRFQVEFDQPCYGVAPGQAVVCYQDDVVLGGGWIESSEPERLT